jgi:hypothetical protein
MSTQATFRHSDIDIYIHYSPGDNSIPAMRLSGVKGNTSPKNYLDSGFCNAEYLPCGESTGRFCRAYRFATVTLCIVYTHYTIFQLLPYRGLQNCFVRPSSWNS